MDAPGSPSRSPTLPKQSSPASAQNPAIKKPASGCNRLGRYLVTGKLGQGGMGVVYQAEDALLKRKVAIKLLPKEFSAHPEALKRFLREGQAAAKLSHANVVAVYDIGEADGSYFIVMELITGGTAQDFLRERGPFHWTEATSILMDVCRGVAAAHKAGLIHRDIKPANILRSTDGVVKLGDFGLVKPAGRTGTVVTALGSVVGTPHYMSPEQSQSGSVDARSDIYALGATYFALLTGRPPYLAADSMQVLFAHCSKPIPDPREIVAEVPEKCAAIIRQAMAKSRGQRYASAAAMLADLEQALSLSQGSPSAQSVGKPPAFAWSKGQRTETSGPLSLADAYPGERTEPMLAPKRRPWWLLGLGAAAVALLGVVGLVLLLGFLFMDRNRPLPGPKPEQEVVGQEDWPSLAAAADKAIQKRNLAAMRAALDKIKLLQKRTQDEKQQEAMAKTLAQLAKTAAFRERITDKGLVLPVDGIVTSVAVSPDTRWLAAGQGSGSAGAVVYDGHTGEKRFTLWPKDAKGMVNVQALAFSYDSDVLAAACADNLGIRLRNIAEGKDSLLPVGAGVNRALSVTFSPKSRDLVAGLEPTIEGRGRPFLKIWDIDTRKEPFLFKPEHTGKIWSVAYCAGGHQVATGSQDKRVVLWNAETGRIWRELQTGLIVHALASGPQGRLMAVAGADQNGSVLQFWDYPASQLLASKPSPHGPCRCVAFSSDGSVLASGSGSNVLLWNAETHELLATLPGHGQTVTALAFFADGGILATGSDDQTVRLWDVTRFLPP